MADDYDYDDLEELADDWWDDEPVYVKEEPDCPACNDAGCRSCEPTRLDLWRSSIRWRLHRLRARVGRRTTFDNEHPF